MDKKYLLNNTVDIFGYIDIVENVILKILIHQLLYKYNPGKDIHKKYTIFLRGKAA